MTNRKIPIILEENPTMGTEQAFVIAQEMCMESTVTDSTEGECKGCGCNDTKEEKDDGCPMNEPECPNYSKQKSLPLLDLDELMKKVDSLNEKVETLLKEKKDAKKEVETDLRERKLEILRRAVSNYLAQKKSNMEDI